MRVRGKVVHNMAVTGSALYNNHNHTLYIELSPNNHLFFIVVACPIHIL